jgi:hypothetical protein
MIELFTQLTHCHHHQLQGMALTELPSELFRMKNVKTLSLYRNYISSLPSEIAHMTKLEGLEVRLSKRLVRDLTKSHAQVTNNLLVSLPPELGLLTNLKRLYVRHSREMDLALTQRRVLSGQRKPPDVAASGNRPTGTARAARSMKFEVSREPDLVCACRSTTTSSNGCRPSWASCRSSTCSGCDVWFRLFSFLTRPPLQLYGNPLPTIAGLPFEYSHVSAQQCAYRINQILAASMHIGTIRKRATEICIGLEDLELPAFVTLAIIDEAVHENSIRMWAKWELITSVKHFRDRRGRER